MIYKETPNGAYGIKPTHFYGKSTDIKPTDCGNASTFYEFDTKKLFMFDAEDKVWFEQ